MLFNFQTFGGFPFPDAVLLWLYFFIIVYSALFLLITSPLSCWGYSDRHVTPLDIDLPGYRALRLSLSPPPFSLAWMISKGCPSVSHKSESLCPTWSPFSTPPHPHTFSTPGPWMSGLRAFRLHVTSILSFSSTYVLSSLSSALADNLSHSPE